MEDAQQFSRNLITLAIYEATGGPARHPVDRVQVRERLWNYMTRMAEGESFEVIAKAVLGRFGGNGDFGELVRAGAAGKPPGP